MEVFWKVKEVADYVRLSVATVYRYTARGQIPFHKINQSVRFNPSEIKRWMESRKTGLSLSQKENSPNNTTDSLFPQGGGGEV